MVRLRGTPTVPTTLTVRHGGLLLIESNELVHVERDDQEHAAVYGPCQPRGLDGLGGGLVVVVTQDESDCLISGPF